MDLSALVGHSLLPIVGIAGGAGSGKDTAADFLIGDVDYTPYYVVKIALADPIKRAAMAWYGFTHEQLWGPSELRNKPDPRWVRLDAAACTDFDAKISAWHRGVDTVDGPRVELHEYLGLTWEEYADWVETRVVHLTPRFALQRLGTEVGRTCSRWTWVSVLFKTILALHTQGGSYNPQVGYIPRSHSAGNAQPDLFVVPDVRFIEEAQAIRFARGEVVGVTRPNRKAVGVGHASEAAFGASGFGSLDPFLTDTIDNSGTLQDLEQGIWRPANRLLTRHARA